VHRPRTGSGFVIVTIVVMPDDLAQLFVEESADACVLISCTGRVEFWNRGAESVFGHAREEALNRAKFKQVLYNLLSNAIKFTIEGGRVKIVAMPRAGHRLQLQVRDTGIGIRPGDFDRLFVEFSQLDSGPARRFDGTGLGLALTKKIIETQHGEISVASEPGKGSTFTVVLPLEPGMKAS
jgi:signal transduction histidine kinase